MGILEKVAKRSSYPHKLHNGEQIHVRALSIDQLDRIDRLEPRLKTGFLLGCCTCSESGTPDFIQQPEETDAQFAESVLRRYREAGIGTDTLNEIQRAIGRVGKGDAEEIAKN